MRTRVLLAGFGLMASVMSAPGLQAMAAPAISHHPRIAAGVHRNLGWASSNWSGYASTASAPYTSVTGTWIVPTVLPTRKATFSSSWVGIDGFNNSSLIQSGTEQDYYRGAAHYSAWWEILPAPATVIPTITISPGDHMSVTITRGSGSSWTISISDVTTSQSFSTTQTYTGPGASAEWIEEAPTVGGRIATLAHYGQSTFDPGTANGVNPGLTPADGGVMIQKGAQVSTPSNPDIDTDGFNIAYGSTQPAPNAS